MEEQTPYLNDDEITTATLENVFKAAFMKVTVDEDGDLRIETDMGTKVFLTVDDERKLLVFKCGFGLREDADDLERIDLVNRLNVNVILVRFASPKADLLYCDYFLPTEGGLPSYQIVNALRMFARVVFGALREYDTDDLVE